MTEKTKTLSPEEEWKNTKKEMGLYILGNLSDQEKSDLILHWIDTMGDINFFNQWYMQDDESNNFEDISEKLFYKMQEKFSGRDFVEGVEKLFYKTKIIGEEFHEKSRENKENKNEK